MTLLFLISFGAEVATPVREKVEARESAGVQTTSGLANDERKVSAVVEINNILYQSKNKKRDRAIAALNASHGSHYPLHYVWMVLLYKSSIL